MITALQFYCEPIFIFETLALHKKQTLWQDLMIISWGSAAVGNRKRQPGNFGPESFVLNSFFS